HGLDRGTRGPPGDPGGGALRDPPDRRGERGRDLGERMNAASTNAQKYESGNPILQWLIGRFHRRIAEVVRPLGVRTVLDVGCGEGYLARHLLDHVPGIELWGVDASESAIAAAQKRCPEA